MPRIPIQSSTLGIDDSIVSSFKLDSLETGLQGALNIYTRPLSRRIIMQTLPKLRETRECTMSETVPESVPRKKK